ncbi:MAG: hypothetical protein WC782_03100 [Methylococcaceae bacterium]|jgi:hypothetical protein
MSLNFTNLFPGHQWFDMNVPDWYGERVGALVQTLGDDNQELAILKNILSDGKLTEEHIQNTNALASSTQQPEIFLLAVDIANHACTIMQAISLIVPVNKPANA